MEDSSSKRKPSPLRGAARREAIILAAMDVMTEEGVSRMSMGAVAARASASKETVYRHFDDRNGLLIAVLTRFAELHIESCPPASDAESLEDGLSRLGLWYLEMATRSEVLSFYRFIAGAVEENPALGEAFTEQVTVPIVATLEAFLIDHGIIGNVGQLAQAFMGLLQGKVWNRALVEPRFTITPEELERQVQLAARLFASSLRVGSASYCP